MTKNKNILLTGASGFVGQNLATYLKKQNLRVTCLDGRIEYDSTYTDIENNERILNADCVIHMASTTHNYHIHELDSNIDIVTNLIGTQKLLQSIIKIRPDNLPRLIYVSTFFAGVNGLYGVTKECAENMIKVYGDVYGLDCCVARLSNVYGEIPSSVLDSKPKVLMFNKMVRDLSYNKQVSLYNEPYPHARDYIHIDDVCSALYGLINTGPTNNHMFNIGTGISLPFGDLIYAAAEAAQVSKHNIMCKTPPNLHKKVAVHSYYTDISNLVEHTNWKPQIFILDGVRRLVEYYQSEAKTNES
jgi:nucleoside-diphosphate-sugar epimerase